MLADRLPGRDVAARLLGVTPSADEATVRRAFRAWAGLVHPDHGGDAQQFQALCDARDALLGATADPEPSLAPLPRRAWSDVAQCPGAAVLVLLAIGFAGTVAAVLPAGSSPLLALLAGVAAAAWCVAVSRAVLDGADHGHVIVARSLAWGVATGAQFIVATVVGVTLVDVLPLLAVPFVAVIAAVNPAAGLWRVTRS